MKPWAILPAQLAHDLAPLALRLTDRLLGSDKPLRFLPVEFRGLRFSNPLGIAGGVDKTGKSAKQWFRLGAGFVEIGTVTPLPQQANPGPILKRNWQKKFLWNRMGFPNPGAEAVQMTLKKIKAKLPGPLFINVGKNRQTANEDAAQDYINCMQKLEHVADAFVLNISSPNTQGLRELQGENFFAQFLEPILKVTTKPVLAKLSPDLSEKELAQILEVGWGLKLSGFILTNTTLTRPQPDSFPEQGGFSGQMVKAKSVEILKRTSTLLGPRAKELLIISTGGVTSARDVIERLELGANLVQMYSALVFEGPLHFRKLARDLS